MFMEDGPPPPPPNNNINHLFTSPSLPSSAASLHPHPLLNQPMQNPQIVSDFDWATILSTTSININGAADHRTLPVSPGVSLTSRNISEGDHHANKYKGRTGKTKKYVPPRIAFHTRSSEDILDDGYKWRKYGQKAVKNSAHPRSYYRCTHHTCNVKKQIQRLSKDTRIVVTTYEGIHNHPCEKLMETLSPLLKQLQFLSRF